MRRNALVIVLALLFNAQALPAENQTHSAIAESAASKEMPAAASKESADSKKMPAANKESAPTDPRALLQQVTEQVFVALSEMAAEPPHKVRRRIFEIVDSVLDFTAITIGAVGRYWRQANASQRTALVDEFSQLLVHSYTRALREYPMPQLRYLPTRPGSRPGRLIVRCEVINGSGTKLVTLDYLLFEKEESWRVYDVQIESISLLINYRQSFGEHIRQKGLNSLIASLAEKNRVLAEQTSF